MPAGRSATLHRLSSPPAVPCVRLFPRTQTHGHQNMAERPVAVSLCLLGVRFRCAGAACFRALEDLSTFFLFSPLPPALHLFVIPYPSFSAFIQHIFLLHVPVSQAQRATNVQGWSLGLRLIRCAAAWSGSGRGESSQHTERADRALQVQREAVVAQQWKQGSETK